MEPLFTSGQARDEARRQRRHSRIAWVVGVPVIAAFAALAVAVDEPAVGLLPVMVVVPALVVATAMARRTSARWEVVAASPAHREWHGTVTSFSTNTYGARWGVNVSVDSSSALTLRLMFQGPGNPGYGRKRLRVGDRVLFQLTGDDKYKGGALRNESTGDVVLVYTRQRVP